MAQNDWAPTKDELAAGLSIGKHLTFCFLSIKLKSAQQGDLSRGRVSGAGIGGCVYLHAALGSVPTQCMQVCF